MGWTIETITKLQAAKRQLIAAIQLFFERKDSIAIQTLTGASHQILYDLAKPKKILSLIKDSPLIRPDKKGEWVKTINEAQNFLKHADRDPEASIDFRPTLSQFLLMDAIVFYQQLTGDIFHEAKVYLTWFDLTHIDLLVESEFKNLISEMAKGIDPDDFEAFCVLLQFKE